MEKTSTELANQIFAEVMPESGVDITIQDLRTCSGQWGKLVDRIDAAWQSESRIGEVYQTPDGRELVIFLRFPLPLDCSKDERTRLAIDSFRRLYDSKEQNE